MRRKVLLLASALALTLGGPRPALAQPCEDYCGEKAAANCDDIDSFGCAMYIVGCLVGCSVQQLT